VVGQTRPPLRAECCLSQFVAQLHQGDTEHVLAFAGASTAVAVAPELVVPRVAFDELVRVSGDELVSELRLAELCFEYLFHEKQSHVSPIRDDSNFSAAPLGNQRRLRREDPRTFGWVVSSQRLIRVFGCRVNVVADADRKTVEVAEKVRGASKIINQVLLFCCRDGWPLKIQHDVVADQTR
jgi:hypothetical protein